MIHQTINPAAILWGHRCCLWVRFKDLNQDILRGDYSRLASEKIHHLWSSFK